MKHKKAFAFLGSSMAMMLTVFATSPIASAQLSVTTYLGKGMRGAEVSALQRDLAKDKTIYPQGYVTGYFGVLTEQAVKKFQARYNLPVTGQVDQATREKLATAVASGFSNDTTAPVISSVAVATAGASWTKNPVVTWTTNEGTKTNFYYDTKPYLPAEFAGMGEAHGFVVTDSVFRTTHTLDVANLTPNTTYFYAIQSRDIAGNMAVSVGSFLTGSLR